MKFSNTTLCRMFFIVFMSVYSVVNLFSQSDDLMDRNKYAVINPVKPDWWRSYRGRLDSRGVKLISGGGFWATPAMKIKTRHDIWIEYIGISGSSMWVPGMLDLDLEFSTTEHPASMDLSTKTIEPGSPLFVGFFRFYIQSNINGKGYRVWSKERNKLLGEEFFGDIPDPLPVYLEMYKGDSFIIHSSVPGIRTWAIDARWSVDGKQWGYTRGNVNVGITGGEERYELWDRRIEPWVFENNPYPIIEADIYIGLHRINKRFEYGKSPSALHGDYYTPLDPAREDEDRARVERLIDEKRELIIRRHRQDELNKMSPAQRKIEEDNDRRKAYDKERLRMQQDRIKKEIEEKIKRQSTGEVKKD